MEVSGPWRPETLLQTHQVNLIVATYSTTPARAELVDFAGPCFIAHQGLLIRQDDDSVAVGSIGAGVPGATRPTTGLSTLNGKYNGVLKVLSTTFSDERYGVGIPKGNARLVTEVNTALRNYIADGSWKQSLERTSPPRVTRCRRRPPQEPADTINAI